MKIIVNLGRLRVNWPEMVSNIDNILNKYIIQSYANDLEAWFQNLHIFDSNCIINPLIHHFISNGDDKLHPFREICHFPDCLKFLFYTAV